MSAAIDLMVPFYGDEQLLRSLVASVQSQTSTDWRLVVVDDAWPGGSVEPWLRSLEEPRIEYVRNPVNLGVSRNFQRCLELARAELVCFPGGDDELLPDYVATVVEVADRTGAALVQTGVQVLDRVGEVVRPLGDRVKAALSPRSAVVLEGEPLARSLLLGNWAYFPSLCWRRERALRHGFRPDLDVVLDLRLILELVLDGEQLAYDPTVCFAYRRHAASVSARTALAASRFTEEAEVMRWAASACRGRGWTAAARAGAWRPTSRLHAASLLPSVVRARDGAAARSLARHAFGAAS